MESDIIRSSGCDTCVSIWVDGMMRDVAISPETIRDWMSTSQPVSNDECRSFVSSRIAYVQHAARQKLLETDPDARSVSL